MKWINELHPIPRYGLAAVCVDGRLSPSEFDFSDKVSLLNKTIEIISVQKSYVLMKANKTNKPHEYEYMNVGGGDLNPGKKSGQISAFGYFIYPHITTSNNAADLVKEVDKIIASAKKQDPDMSYELKRSISPVVAKFNGGNKSMSNPKVTLLEAALTTVGVMTRKKPAAYDFDNTSNICLIPDLPFFDPENKTYPLVDFFKLIKTPLMDGVGQEIMIGGFQEKEKRYKRPPIFFGNYPDPPNSFNFGAISVLASLGGWIKEHRYIYDSIDELTYIIEDLVKRPLFIFSYAGSRQEIFGHHLKDMAIDGYLSTLTRNTGRVALLNVDRKTKYSNPVWKKFINDFDHFLRFFNQSSFQKFASTRAYYPSEFTKLFKTYFMEIQKIPKDVIDSALEYGKSLNTAAYVTAKKQNQDDINNKRSNSPTIEEYKNRTLTQFESTIRSAKSITSLFAQMGTIVGRITNRDINQEGSYFIEQALTEESVANVAKDLMITFMRLNTKKSKKNSEETQINS